MDLRIGQVTDVDSSENAVRVHFPDVDIVSGWLKVVQSTSSVWMPSEGDTVLCIYGSGFSADGFVIGRLE